MSRSNPSELIRTLSVALLLTSACGAPAAGLSGGGKAEELGGACPDRITETDTYRAERYLDPWVDRFAALERRPPAIPDVASTADGAALAGDRIVIRGRVVDADCQPVAGVSIDIWQPDQQGFYDVDRGAVAAGGGLRATISTDADGRYVFETIFPGPHWLDEDQRFRPPHINLRVGGSLLTQIYFAGVNLINQGLTEAAFDASETPSTLRAPLEALNAADRLPDGGGAFAQVAPEFVGQMGMAQRGSNHGPRALAPLPGDDLRIAEFAQTIQRAVDAPYYYYFFDVRLPR